MARIGGCNVSPKEVEVLTKPQSLGMWIWKWGGVSLRMTELRWGHQCGPSWYPSENGTFGQRDRHREKTTWGPGVKPKGRGCRRNQACWTPWPLTCGLQNRETGHFCCFSCPSKQTKQQVRYEGRSPQGRLLRQVREAKKLQVWDFKILLAQKSINQ